MRKPSTDPSILNEPHLSGELFSVDESEEKATAVLAAAEENSGQAVEHTVWDEPALSSELAAAIPESALTYEKWLRGKIEETSPASSWIMTFLLAVVSAPLAVVGVFILHFQGMGSFGGLAVVVFGPVIEEMLKISATLITLEKRPYLFKTARQIVVACVFSGLVFAFMENLLYLNVYIRNPTPALVLWRWTVCVLLHSGCTAMSSVGLVKVWSTATANLRRPCLSIMTGYVVAASVIHGLYNLIALFLNPLFQG
jgi:hypothetical protein